LAERCGYAGGSAAARPPGHEAARVGCSGKLAGLDLQARRRAATRMPKRQNFNDRLFDRDGIVKMIVNSAENDAPNTRNCGVLDPLSRIREFLDER